jgi:hypothetical protein
MAHTAEKDCEEKALFPQCINYGHLLTDSQKNVSFLNKRSPFFPRIFSSSFLLSFVFEENVGR